MPGDTSCGPHEGTGDFASGRAAGTVVFLFALVLRLAYLWGSADAPTFWDPIVDAGTYDALARQLIDIDSTTGREGEVAAVLAAYLRGLGYSVLEQPLGNRRTTDSGLSPHGLTAFANHADFGGRQNDRGRCVGGPACPGPDFFFPAYRRSHG